MKHLSGGSRLAIMDVALGLGKMAALEQRSDTIYSKSSPSTYAAISDLATNVREQIKVLQENLQELEELLPRCSKGV